MSRVFFEEYLFARIHLKLEMFNERIGEVVLPRHEKRACVVHAYGDDADGSEPSLDCQLKNIPDFVIGVRAFRNGSFSRPHRNVKPRLLHSNLKRNTSVA